MIEWKDFGSCRLVYVHVNGRRYIWWLLPSSATIWSSHVALFLIYNTDTLMPRPHNNNETNVIIMLKIIWHFSPQSQPRFLCLRQVFFSLSLSLCANLQISMQRSCSIKSSKPDHKQGYFMNTSCPFLGTFYARPGLASWRLSSQFSALKLNSYDELTNWPFQSPQTLKYFASDSHTKLCTLILWAIARKKQQKFQRS